MSSSVISAAATFLAIPFYLRILGTEAYGVIGFFLVVQGLFQLLDLGMAPTVSRQIARAVSPVDKDKIRDLVYSLAWIYWSIGTVAAVLMIGFADQIAGKWLKADDLQPSEIAIAVGLMGLTLAAKWPSSLYGAALIGAERLPTVSGVTIAMVIAANLGSILVLVFVSSTLKAFFIWQFIVGMGQTFIMRRAVWRTLPSSQRARIDMGELRKVWAFSAGMTGITIAGITLSQLDKLILSRLISLAEFGNYMIAALVASMLVLVARPMFHTIYPRMSRLIVDHNEADLIRTYHLATRFLASIVFSMAMAMVVYGEDFLVLWIGRSAFERSTVFSIALLSAGSALNAVMHIPYALQLAFGKVRLAFGISATLAIVMVPLIIALATRYGVVGGASAWLILNTVYVVGGTWITHRTLLPGEGLRWFFQGVAVPLILTICFGIVAQTLRSVVPANQIGQLLIGTMLAASCTLACLVSYKPFRKIFRILVVTKFQSLRARGVI